MSRFYFKGEILPTIVGDTISGIKVENYDDDSLRGELKGGRILKVSLYKGRISDRYLGIQLEILSSKEELIDRQRIGFLDCASTSVRNLNKKNNNGFYVWDGSDGYDWYLVRPDKQTSENLKEYMKKYVNLYK